MHTFPIPLRYCSLHAFIKYLFVSNAISVHIRNPSIDVYKRLIVFFFFLYISVGVHLHANITHFHSICKFFSLPDSCELLHIYTIGTSFIFGVSWPTQKQTKHRVVLNRAECAFINLIKHTALNDEWHMRLQEFFFSE